MVEKYCNYQCRLDKELPGVGAATRSTWLGPTFTTRLAMALFSMTQTTVRNKPAKQSQFISTVGFNLLIIQIVSLSLTLKYRDTSHSYYVTATSVDT